MFLVAIPADGRREACGTKSRGSINAPFLREDKKAFANPYLIYNGTPFLQRRPDTAPPFRFHEKPAGEDFSGHPSKCVSNHERSGLVGSPDPQQPGGPASRDKTRATAYGSTIPGILSDRTVGNAPRRHFARATFAALRRRRRKKRTEGRSSPFAATQAVARRDSRSEKSMTETGNFERRHDGYGSQPSGATAYDAAFCPPRHPNDTRTDRAPLSADTERRTAVSDFRVRLRPPERKREETARSRLFPYEPRRNARQAFTLRKRFVSSFADILFCDARPHRRPTTRRNAPALSRTRHRTDRTVRSPQRRNRPPPSSNGPCRRRRPDLRSRLQPRWPD